jgi:hypothetical protein
MSNRHLLRTRLILFWLVVASLAGYLLVMGRARGVQLPSCSDASQPLCECDDTYTEQAARCRRMRRRRAKNACMSVADDELLGCRLRWSEGVNQ